MTVSAGQIRTFSTGYVPQRVHVSENFGWDIIAFGRQNTYPQEIEYAVARSGIASACVKVFGEFLYGNGFEQGGDLVVNTKGETLNTVLRQVCCEFALHAGFALLTNCNMNALYTSIECQTFSFVRLMRPHDGEGDRIEKAKISDDWAGESWKNSASPSFAKQIDLFNPHELSELVSEMEFEDIANYCADDVEAVRKVYNKLNFNY